MPFDNRHTVAARRSVLPSMGGEPRTFVKGVALGVVLAAVSGIVIVPALFAGRDRVPFPAPSAPVLAVAASTPASVASPPAAPSAPAPVVVASAVPVVPAAATSSTPAPTPPAASPAPAQVAPVDPQPAASPTAVAAVTPTGSPDPPAADSGETKLQAQNPDSRPRHRHRRHFARQAYWGGPFGWFNNFGRSPFWRTQHRRRTASQR
jgi:hypothetical protein